MIAAFAVALFAFAGTAFAMPNGFGGWMGHGGNAAWQNQTGNWTGYAPGQNQTVNWSQAAWQKQTWGMHRGFNSSFNGTKFSHRHRFGPGQGFNGTRGGPMPGFNSTFNSTQIGSFRQAVQSGDYEAALQMHQSTGIGGSVFDKLNSTTFSMYSQIFNLESQIQVLEGQLKALGINFMPGAGVATGHNFAFGHNFSRGMHSKQSNTTAEN